MQETIDQHNAWLATCLDEFVRLTLIEKIHERYALLEKDQPCAGRILLDTEAREQLKEQIKQKLRTITAAEITAALDAAATGPKPSNRRWAWLAWLSAQWNATKAMALRRIRVLAMPP
jgi:hypothetical protein